MRKKSIIIKFRVDPVIYSTIKTKAFINKISVSDYIRSLIYADLNKKPIEEEEDIIEDDFSYKKPDQLKLHYIM
jgi:hypothetical protein